jgi:endonuclease YncB( thermonuclease family)
VVRLSRTTTVSVSHRSTPLRLGLLVLLVLVYAGEVRSIQARLVRSNPKPPSFHVLTGRVVKVVDGDTIYVLDDALTQHKIRLAGIDAPEKNQPYGLASRKHLASLVAGKSVTVEYTKYDRYGRIIGKVVINGVDVCLEQIKAGLAWHYKRYENEQAPEDRKMYARAEDQARTGRIGLWRDNNPRPPWEFRRFYRSRTSEEQGDTIRRDVTLLEAGLYRTSL